jgi:tetratricopeptide (TPR) repeat protein
MDCLGEPTVAALLAGSLSVEDRGSAEAHLATCAECLELVAELARAPAGTGPADRYELGEEIARGGMGRIFAATDRVLGRAVAIKKLRTPVAGLAERFLREMRLTARLQHPAIVPIYDAGVLADGEPFYAMRKVAGVTLEAALAAATTREARVALVPAVLAVADAIAYAHGEGIIHRDLKPANVLVGTFGEVVILDWGIAKDLRATAVPAADDADGTAASASARIEPLTVDGAVMGTPGYMAPEQASGEPGDERTDVYGLGGMLYHVLAGAPPHGKDRTAPVPPLASRQPGLPPDLIAIVDRALAPEPADRYPTARELSDDLRRFQAGRLVEAHRYSFAQLIRRFVARHRAAVAIAVVALAVIATVSTIAVRRVVAQRRVAVEEREAAEALVELLLRDLRESLEKVGRIDVLAPVGARVDAYYERVGIKGRTDQLRRATAQWIIGEARLGAGDLDGALAAFRVGLAWTEKADADPITTCHARQRIADALRAKGELVAAAAEHRACLALAPGPEQRAASLVELGGIAKARGELAEAGRLLDEARAVAEHVPGKLVLKIDDDRGLLANERGDFEAARVAFYANVDRARTRLAEAPEDPERVRDLVTCLAQAGQNDEIRGELAAAGVKFAEALQHAEALAVRDPANTLWQRDLAIAHDHVGALAIARGDLQAALVKLDASEAIMQRLVASQPGNADWQRDLGVGAVTRAGVQRELGHLDAARAALDQARRIFEALAAGQPAGSGFANDLSVVLAHAGDLALAQGRAADATAALEASLAIRRERLAAADTPLARMQLAEVLLLLDRVDEAVAVIEPVRADADVNPDLESLIEDIDAARKRP